MKLAILVLAVLLEVVSAAPALACGCELICPEGEEYSDETERCEPVDRPVS
jgi:hypothetical protein